MSRVDQVKTNFTAGELAPEMLGRADLRAWQNGAQRLRNVFIHPTGGVTRRSGLRYIHTAKGPGRLIAFEFNTEQTYLLVLTEGKAEVLAGGAVRAEFDTPWSAAQLGQINWTQSADTLLVVHPQVPPQKITRTSHSDWSILPWQFAARDGVSHQPFHKFAAEEATLTPAATTGSFKVEASADVFTEAMVGTRLRIGGKQVVIDSLLSAREAMVTAQEELSGTEATTDWEEQAFSERRGWPVSVCFHQDRLVIGGSHSLPNRLWLSKSADLFNFDQGTGLDDEAIEFPILSDQVNAIRAVFSGRHLQVFTSGAEWTVSGEPLTPMNLQLRRQTRVGSPLDRTVPPCDVDGATIFVSRAGGELREFLYTDVEQAYQATDLSMLARHLMLRPVEIDYDAPSRLLHVVREDGAIATVTNYRAEAVTAWSLLQTDGGVRSIACLAEEVYLLVERVGRYGLPVFLVERFEAALNTDSALTGRVAVPTDRWQGLEHLEGRRVRVVGDGSDMGEAVVSGGAITLDQPVREVEIGLPFRHEVWPLPPAVESAGGPGRPTQLRLVQVVFRLLETSALTVDTGRGATELPLRRMGEEGLLDGPLPRITGDVPVRALGWQRQAVAPLWRVGQDTPLPCTILSVTTQMKVS
ncbi:hypothetical protein [Telmatospirillum sp. J64-1]|uniref:hypothetical protein n=1 Tax=Telmatospirillum sp. J64-1 TaxID=2502183 RepID=UPI00115EF972|nr:hypothetical protein [Telmatospirillum sp. J64-1]